jgi:putative membrane protein
MWGHMMDWGGGAAFGLWHLFWWALLIAAAVVVVRALAADRRPDPGDRALQILKERYARGEIDKAEFETRKHDLT